MTVSDFVVVIYIGEVMVMVMVIYIERRESFCATVEHKVLIRRRISAVDQEASIT